MACVSRNGQEYAGHVLAVHTGGALFPVPIIARRSWAGILLVMNSRPFFKKTNLSSHHDDEKRAARCRKIFCDVIPARMRFFDAWIILMACRPL